MKLEYLQKIIARIQTQIHCPKCKAPFAKEKIEIQTVKGHLVEFAAECAECKARSQISAEISGPSLKPAPAPAATTEVKIKRPLPGFELPKAKLKPTDLEPLKADLSNFKGDDIKALFGE
jgi:hypothetical protein